jgi:D-alanine-D-alanine ligase
MRVVVAHNAVSDADAPDERDVLVQAEAVAAALETGGHQPVTLACDLDLAAAASKLVALQPDIVFNLVESLNGQCRLLPLFPALLDSLGIAYTGSPTEALWITTHKLMAKDRMAAAGLPTPAWIGPCPPDLPSLFDAAPHRGRIPDQRWIVKSLWEHASFGLDDDGLITGFDRPQIEAVLKDRAPRLGGACFAEAYIDGREFNLSLLGGPDGPEVLPPAEIVFEGFDEGTLRIVGYRAKWMTDSFEYSHTPRCFDFLPQDAPLLGSLAQAALRCWEIFGLCGYARVDFRVDAAGAPHILEVNTNPCLSPDAGFAAALERAGMAFPQAVERIVAGGFRR